MGAKFRDTVKHDKLRNRLEISVGGEYQSLDDNNLTSSFNGSKTNNTLTTLAKALVEFVEAVERLVVALTDDAEVLGLRNVLHFCDFVVVVFWVI